MDLPHILLWIWYGLQLAGTGYRLVDRLSKDEIGASKGSVLLGTLLFVLLATYTVANV